jgi:hypothetical protein
MLLRLRRLSRRISAALGPAGPLPLAAASGVAGAPAVARGLEFFPGRVHVPLPRAVAGLHAPPQQRHGIGGFHGQRPGGGHGEIDTRGLKLAVVGIVKIVEHIDAAAKQRVLVDHAELAVQAAPAFRHQQAQAAQARCRGASTQTSRLWPPRISRATRQARGWCLCRPPAPEPSRRAGPREPAPRPPRPRRRGNQKCRFPAVPRFAPHRAPSRARGKNPARPGADAACRTCGVEAWPVAFFLEVRVGGEVRPI